MILLAQLKIKNGAKMEKTKIMVRSNHLISAGYQLPPNQQLLLYAVLSKLDQDKTVYPATPYRVSAHEFALLAGITYAAAYKALLEASRTLQAKLLYLPNPDPKMRLLKRDTRQTLSWVDKLVPYCDHETEESGVDFYFGESIAPFLTDLRSNFSKVPLKNIISLDGFYARRFYEYFIYLKFKNKSEVYFTISELRQMFNLDNKETKKSIYPQIGSFKKYVIDAAVNEINEKISDLHVSYVSVKKGRRVEGYNFTYIFKKEKEVKEKFAKLPATESAKPELKTSLAPPVKPAESEAPKESAAAKNMREQAEIYQLKEAALALGFEDVDGVEKVFKLTKDLEGMKRMLALIEAMQDKL